MSLTPRITTTVAALAAAALSLGATSAPADESSPAPSSRAGGVSLTPIGTYSTGVFDEGAAEIVAYYPAMSRVFVVNADAGTVDVLSIKDPTKPRKVATLDTPGANSVAVSHGRVAVAQENERKPRRGTVAFFRGRTLEKVNEVPVGVLPDMVKFTPDGTTVLTANEGEPVGYCQDQADPAGSVSVIDISRSLADATVRRAGFARWIGREAELRRAGVRIYGPGANANRDLEPEYIATNASGTRAYVTLQENNAIAVVDVPRAKVLSIKALGTKDFSKPGQGLDPSDKDGGPKIGTYPVRGYYSPDSIARYSSGGRDYLVTANEGDTRDWPCYSEETRVSDVDLDPEAFPNADALQSDEQLGRLTITRTAGAGDDGYRRLYVPGGRSVSIRRPDGTLVWDSGSALERITASKLPEFFNAGNDENDSADSRSDNKGPEPEGVTVGRVGGRTYAFAGLERTGGLVAVDVTDPTQARVVEYANNRDNTGDPEAGTAGDLGPEGVLFVPATKSPNGHPLVLVGNEISGTTTVWQVN